MDSFKQDILDLMKDDKKRKLLGTNAKKTIETDYPVEKMVSSYELLYEKLLGEKSK